jgi:hypothetical protein
LLFSGVSVKKMVLWVKGKGTTPCVVLVLKEQARAKASEMIRDLALKGVNAWFGFAKRDQGRKKGQR